MSKTEGPWYVDGPLLTSNGKESFVVKRVAFKFEYDTLADAEWKLAELNEFENMNAAAPELLAACKETLEILDDLKSNDGISLPALESMLNAAIAKANPCYTKSNG